MADDAPMDRPRIDELRTRLADSEAERRTLLDILDLVPFYLYAIDEEGRYKLANREVAEDLGHTTESIKTVRFQDVSPDPEQSQALVDEVRAKLDAGIPIVTRDVRLRVNRIGDAVMDLFEAPFTDADGKRWLLGIGRDKSSEVELERARVERARLDRDMSIARGIQRSLLPQTRPACQGLDVHGWSEPADDTGGDFFDWFRTDAGETCFVLGDVTGHGVGPAIIAATTRAYVRAIFSAAAPLDELLGRLNDRIADELPDNFFVTLAIARVPDDQPAAAGYISAGHGPTFYRRPDRYGASALQELDSHGPPLGIVPGIDYAEPTHIPMMGGARLVLASDGLHERARADGRQFGADRLARIVADHQNDAEALLERMRRQTDDFAGGVRPADDMTAVAVFAL